MSFEPKVAQKGPYILDEAEGAKRFWCACGLSATQPFCDGSHKREGTGLNPIKVVCEKAGSVAYCGCKHSGNKPYCDGTHKTL